MTVDGMELAKTARKKRESRHQILHWIGCTKTMQNNAEAPPGEWRVAASGCAAQVPCGPY